MNAHTTLMLTTADTPDSKTTSFELREHPLPLRGLAHRLIAPSLTAINDRTHESQSTVCDQHPTCLCEQLPCTPLLQHAHPQSAAEVSSRTLPFISTQFNINDRPLTHRTPFAILLSAISPVTLRLQRRACDITPHGAATCGRPQASIANIKLRRRRSDEPFLLARDDVVYEDHTTLLVIRASEERKGNHLAETWCH